MPAKLYSSQGAADYLGIHLQTLRYHVNERKHLTPDYEIGGSLVFTQKTLDEFRRRHQATEGYTMSEAAAYLGVNFTWLRYHVYTSKKIAPDGRRGNALIFTRSTLDAARARLLAAADA